MTTTGEVLLSVKEVAKVLRVCERTVRKLMQKNLLGYISVATETYRIRRRVPQSALDEFIRRRTVEGQG